MGTENAVIKVVCIGGNGRNIINDMIEQGMKGVEFIAIDTDAEALQKSHATTQLKIFPENNIEPALSFDPEVGRAATENSREQIKDMLSEADIIFVVAGMGGATGTGTAPVILQIARELKILSIAIVTRPFEYEGRRVNFAREGIKLCHIYADALLVMPNPPPNLNKADFTVPDAFKLTSQLICQFVSDMVGLLNNSGLIGVDLSDIRPMLSRSGLAKTGSAVASGRDRAKIAVELAMENAHISSAKSLLINVISDASLKLRELDSLMDCVMLSYDHPEVILGATFDESMGEELRVTVMATGLNFYQNEHGDTK